MTDESAIWLLMEPGGETATVMAAYTDPEVAAASETVLRQHKSYCYIEEVTNIQQVPLRIVDHFRLSCRIYPDWSFQYFWPMTTYPEHLVTSDQVSEYPAARVEHTRHLFGRPEDLLPDGAVHVTAEGTDEVAVQAAFDAEVQRVRALLASGELQ